MRPDPPRADTASRLPRGFRGVHRIYTINATLLLSHEIDSARWAEWDLFQLPGGAPLFVALHLLIIPLILLGQAQVVRQQPTARWTALLLGIAGVLGALLHGAFLLSGDGRFATLFSSTLIGAFGLCSALQVTTVLVGWRVFLCSQSEPLGKPDEGSHGAPVVPRPAALDAPAPPLDAPPPSR